MLPTNVRIGDAVVTLVAGRPRLLLVERSDVLAWDLGEPGEPDVDRRITQRVESALTRRAALVPPETTVFRAVHDAADGLPGLVVDIYGEVAVCQIYGAAYAHHAAAIAAPLRQRFAAVRVVERARHGARAQAYDHWFEAQVSTAIVCEAGLRFRVRFDDQLLGTGLFADQREQRARVRLQARGRPVLNLFGYAGGFTVAAAAGGAAQVDHVDLSKATLTWAAENLALNGLSPSRHRMIAEDARRFVERATRREKRYGLVIADPPTYATGKASFQVRSDLRPLLTDCARIIDPNGLMLVSINSRGATHDWLTETALQACENAGRRAAIAAHGGQGPDYPTLGQATALEHLKVVWLQVWDEA